MGFAREFLELRSILDMHPSVEPTRAEWDLEQAVAAGSRLKWKTCLGMIVKRTIKLDNNWEYASIT